MAEYPRLVAVPTSPHQRLGEALAQTQKAYDEVKGMAGQAYDNAMAPVQKAYDEAKAAAGKAYDEAVAPGPQGLP